MELCTETRWTTTDSPAINADPETFAEYLRDQAGYYRSLDTEYSLKLAYELDGMATSIERRDARRAAKCDPAF